MSLWKIEPTWKKSLVEVLHLSKGEYNITHSIGWRWGHFYIETDDNNPPDIEEGVDIFDCGYQVDDWETIDGCWEEMDFKNLPDEEVKIIEEFLEENSVLDLEELGWIMNDTQMFIESPLSITLEETNE